MPLYRVSLLICLKKYYICLKRNFTRTLLFQLVWTINIFVWVYLLAITYVKITLVSGTLLKCMLSNYHIYISIFFFQSTSLIYRTFIFTEHVNPFVLFALKAILVHWDSASDQVLNITSTLTLRNPKQNICIKFSCYLLDLELQMNEW